MYKSQITNSIRVRLDIPGLNPHDFLDYKLKYEKYLVYIHDICRNYISHVHFMSIFSINKNEIRNDLSNMIRNNWLGTFTLGRYKYYYLKRKSLQCILCKDGLSDSNFPSMRQVIRSLMINEIFLNYYVNGFNAFCKKDAPLYEKDVYLQNRIENTYTISILDISRRSDNDLNDIFTCYMQELNSRKAISSFCFVFYTYSNDRANYLKKRFNQAKFSQLHISATSGHPFR